MTNLRVIVGLGILCALALSAFAVQSAAAAVKGTTAFTCKNLEEAAGDFSDAHCKTASAGGKFKHVAIAQSTQTELSVTNEKEGGGKDPIRLKATIAGIPLELVATDAQGSGVVENKLDESGEHFVHASSTTKYTGVTVGVPAGKGCQVYADNGGVKGEEGVIQTNELTTTTTGQGDAGKLTPASGEVVATFFIDGCKGNEGIEKALNKTYAVTGSLSCKPSGATVNCSHTEITTQNTLKLGGTIKAGVEVTTTFKGKDLSIGGDTFKPLSVTTVET